MARNKKTHNIYLLDLDKAKNYFLLSNEETIQGTINIIMSEDKQYSPQKLKKNIDTKGFSINLFFKTDYLYNNKFSDFCSEFLCENEEAVKFVPTFSSSVLFIWKDKKLYAITTGQGYRIVEKFAVQKFGMIIATLFQQHLKVTSLGSNEMSSIIHSSQTVFATEVDFNSVQTLDTIFKEIGGRISDIELVHSLLNLNKESRRNSMKLKAKDYLQFGCSVDFNGLLHLILILDEMDISHISDGFNAITPLTKKHDLEIIKGVNFTILHDIYCSLSNKRKCPFELFHQDTESFILADRYQIYCKNKTYADEEDYDATQLIAKGFNSFLNNEQWSEDKFMDFINSSRIRTINEDRIVTDDTVLNHFSGEIEFEGNTFLVLDGKYYCQSKSYTNRLNEFLQKKLRDEVFTKEIQTIWAKSHNEDWFNDMVARKEGYVKLHRQIIDNMEFADLIKYSKGVLNIVHVKDGFDGEMRILDRQVEISLRMLLDIKVNNNNSFATKLYQKAVSNNKSTNILKHFKTEKEFIDTIKMNKVRYIIVIRPSNKNLLDCKSNVAKHCLNAIIDSCYKRGIELNIQIK